MPTESLVLLDRALDQMTTIISGIRADQAPLATPCDSWDVRTLVAHLMGGLDNYIVRAHGGTPDRTAPAPEPGPDWSGTFRKKADALLDAWRGAGDLGGTLDLPGIGQVPASFPVDQQVTEFAVHSWDLARATGQVVDLDEEVAEHALAWARNELLPEYRGEGSGFGPELPAPAGAPVNDRLAAFFGRQPA